MIERLVTHETAAKYEVGQVYEFPATMRVSSPSRKTHALRRIVLSKEVSALGYVRLVLGKPDPEPAA